MGGRGFEVGQMVEARVGRRGREMIGLKVGAGMKDDPRAERPGTGADSRAGVQTCMLLLLSLVVAVHATPLINGPKRSRTNMWES